MKLAKLDILYNNISRVISTDREKSIYLKEIPRNLGMTTSEHKNRM